MSEMRPTRTGDVPDDVADQGAHTGSALDRWWASVLSTPARRRLWDWGGPALVVAIAAVLRLWHLGNPHALVFDETFYVKDAYTLLNNGYESGWADDADDLFNAGNPNAFTTDPSFVVHPPLGKWIIALGLAVFGADDSVGWRISTAIVGILTVALVMVVARMLFSQTVLTVIAGGLMAIDGNAIVMSRVALLDGHLAFFALLGVTAILLDRRWHAARLSAALASRRSEGIAPDSGTSPGWGPALWWRPWLLAAGVAFGMASAVKWSGIYFLAAFGIYAIVADALARRRAGVPFWATGAVLKQGPISFLLLVPPAVAVYLASWTGWLVSSGGMYRNWASTLGTAWEGALAWVPLWAQNLWHYHAAAYNYHVNLHAAHPYQANPLTWLFMVRPTSMYYAGSVAGEDGCAFSSCSAAITGIGNPLIWWAAAAATIYLLYRLARYREWRVGLILMGLVAGYLPWMLYLDRTVYQFYSIAFEPYLILGLTLALGMILGTRADTTYRRNRGIGVVAVYLGFTVLVSAFFYPLWAGIQVPFWFWQLHIWMPGWR